VARVPATRQRALVRGPAVAERASLQARRRPGFGDHPGVGLGVRQLVELAGSVTSTTIGQPCP
jgi:hypothetical protein